MDVEFGMGGLWTGDLVTLSNSFPLMRACAGTDTTSNRTFRLEEHGKRVTLGSGFETEIIALPITINRIVQQGYLYSRILLEPYRASNSFFIRLIN